MPKNKKRVSSAKRTAGKKAAAMRPRDENGKFIKQTATAAESVESTAVVEKPSYSTSESGFNMARFMTDSSSDTELVITQKPSASKSESMPSTVKAQRRARRYS
jgi:hypothetical protein